MLKIRIYKADNGDCISIKTKSEFILIDGGTAQSFNTWKSQVFGLVDKIDSIIITHIDNDHVNGIIKLLTNSECPTVKNIYFNGAEQLFGQLAVCDNVDHRTNAKLQALSEENSIVSDKDFIGYSEGTSLSYLIFNKGYQCNEAVNGKALYRENCSFFEVGSLKFTVIGPNQKALSELKKIWQNKLIERNIRASILSKSYYDAFEQYISNIRELPPNKYQISSTEKNSIEASANTTFFDDNSPTNKSSFSFLIELDNKRILYLGDCNAETVISWLDEKQQEKIRVDAVKISHHGSQNNTSLELLKRIECDKYLISTNGKSHGHPDIETLSRIALVNKNSDTNIFINYALDTIPDWFITELNASYPRIRILMNYCEVDL